MSKETENNQIPSAESPKSQEPKSYAEWLAKFYPTDAKEFATAEDDEDTVYLFSEADELGPMSKEQKAQEISALKHSIRKWEGLRPETLREYGVHFNYPGVSYVSPDYIAPEEFDSRSDPHLYIDSTSCALCALKATRCSNCSIVGMRYDGTELPEDEFTCEPEFAKMVMNKDPEPMISLLNKTLKFVEGLEIVNE